MAKRVCSRPGCPTLIPADAGSTRCPACQTKADRERGTAAQRGYGREHRDRFREGVLSRNPICVLCHAAWATVADHWPKDRRQLVAEQLDPNDPQYGRGLCASCHGRHTAEAQPGGWADR